MEQGMAAAVKSGMDIICAWPEQQIRTERDAVLKAVQQGLLSNEDIDRAVRRLFTARIKLGLFDPPQSVSYSSISISDNDIEPHRQLALQAARETLVLLKNSQRLLPLGTRYKTIPVIAPNPDNRLPLHQHNNPPPPPPLTPLT